MHAFVYRYSWAVSNGGDSVGDGRSVRGREGVESAAGCLQIQGNKFSVDFQHAFLPVDFYIDRP